MLDINPNVNVISHAGEILAPAEGGAALAISTDLQTLGPSSRHPALAQGMTAHPKIDPVTGGLVRYDRESGSRQRHTIPEGDQNSEAVFVPRPHATSEDDGWVLACVYRQATDSSDVIVLDARDLAGAPLATIRLPRRIPAGFHGAWLPE